MPKSKTTITTTRRVSVEYRRSHLLEILGLPADTDLWMCVPEGADYSGRRLDVDQNDGVLHAMWIEEEEGSEGVDPWAILEEIADQGQYVSGVSHETICAIASAALARRNK